MKGNNFWQQVEVGLALETQSISGATVNGAEIKEPWRKGRQLSFLLVSGDYVAASSGRFRVQGLLRSDGTTWETLKRPDGTTDLEFPVAKLDDAGAGEDAVLIGTLDLSAVDGETYKSLRVTFQSEGAQAMLVGAAYVLSDLYRRPSSQVDELWALQRYAP